MPPAVENVPLLHVVHRDAPELSATRPLAHEVHEVALPFENVPGSQRIYAWPPLSFTNVPGGAGLHSGLARASAKRPGVHERQALAPTSEVSPSPHASHEPRPDLMLKRPAGHSRQ